MKVVLNNTTFVPVCPSVLPTAALTNTQGPSGPRNGASSSSGLAHKPLIHCEAIATLTGETASAEAVRTQGLLTVHPMFLFSQRLSFPAVEPWKLLVHYTTADSSCPVQIPDAQVPSIRPTGDKTEKKDAQTIFQCNIHRTSTSYSGTPTHSQTSHSTGTG